MRRDRNIAPRRQRRHVELPPSERPKQWGMQDVKLHRGRALRRAVEQVVAPTEQLDLLTPLAELATAALDLVSAEAAKHEVALVAMRAVHQAAQQQTTEQPVAVNS